MKKLLAKALMVAVSLVMANGSLMAHEGGLDKSNGHKDNKNVSGLGNYHYHCLGQQAHLHNDKGECPYRVVVLNNDGTLTFNGVNYKAILPEERKSFNKDEYIKRVNNIIGETPLEHLKITANDVKVDEKNKTIKMSLYSTYYTELYYNVQSGKESVDIDGIVKLLDKITGEKVDGFDKVVFEVVDTMHVKQIFTSENGVMTYNKFK